MQTSAILLPWLKKSVWLNHERYQIVFFSNSSKMPIEKLHFYRLKLNISKLNPSYIKVAGVCIFLQITWPMLALFGCTFFVRFSSSIDSRSWSWGQIYFFKTWKVARKHLQIRLGRFCKLLPPIFIWCLKKIRLYW